MSAVFHQAVLDGDTTKVKFILKYGQGIRVNQPNKYGLTALQQACRDGNLALANFLLERGADLSFVDSEGRTALHLASEQGHLDIVSLLVNSACADVNARNGKQDADGKAGNELEQRPSEGSVSTSSKTELKGEGGECQVFVEISCNQILRRVAFLDFLELTDKINESLWIRCEKVLSRSFILVIYLSVSLATL